DPLEWRSMIDTNFIGTLHCCRYLGELMIKRKSGRIINIASTDGIIGKAGQGTELGVDGVVVYAATKGAVVSLTKALAIEWGRYGVNVNAICPSLMETPMTTRLFQSKAKVRRYR